MCSDLISPAPQEQGTRLCSWHVTITLNSKHPHAPSFASTVKCRTPCSCCLLMSLQRPRLTPQSPPLCSARLNCTLLSLLSRATSMDFPYHCLVSLFHLPIPSPIPPTSSSSPLPLPLPLPLPPCMLTVSQAFSRRFLLPLPLRYELLPVL